MDLPSSRLSPMFLKLAGDVGKSHESWDDSQRWEVFELALQRSLPLSEVFAALDEEPDVGVASAAVVRIIEESSDVDVDVWTALLPEGRVRRFAETRASEVRTLQEVLAASPREVAPGVEDWSDWLQRRIVERSTNIEILDQLALRGRTRRIRDSARQRAAVLRRG